MIIDCISDLHGHEPTLPGGDILVIGGDSTARDTEDCWIKFANWLRRQDYDHIVLIAGNHDFMLQNKYNDVSVLFPQNVVYLQDEGVEINGVSFYGMPWTPEFYDWAFMLPRNSKEMREKCSLIPEQVDILITHGPPYGILDTTQRGEPVGSGELVRALATRDIKYHVFGHIHECGGQETVGENGLTCINISYVTLRYKPREVNWCRRITL